MSQSILNLSHNPKFLITKIHFYFNEIENLIKSGKEWSISPGPNSACQRKKEELSKIILVHDIVQKLEFGACEESPFVPSFAINSGLNVEVKKWMKMDYKIIDKTSPSLISYQFSFNPDMVLKIENVLPDNQSTKSVMRSHLPSHSIFFKYDPPSNQIRVEISIP